MPVVRKIKRALRLAFFSLVAAPVTLVASAQVPLGSSGDPSKVADLVFTDHPPKIDGILDDEIWKTATVIDDLHQISPGDGDPPTQRTVFKLAYDEDALYISVYAYETDPSLIVAKEFIQGRSLRNDDGIQIILDPYLNFRSGYSFFLNPNGIRGEGLFEGARNINADWEGIWYAEARIVEDGWIGELAIPFKTISFNGDLTAWGFSVGRFIRRNGERVVWASKNRETNPNAAGILNGVERAQQGLGLDLVPSIAFKGYKINKYQDDSTIPPTQRGGGEDLKIVPSINAFYKLTPAITASLTANTDFSGAAVDDRVVNLTRFSVFFPEKRSFFLQDADIFGFGSVEENGLPFFSRKIGLDADGAPVDLVVGEKVSGRINNWNIGVMHVLQDRQPTVGQSNLMIARASANILAESNVGFITTNGNPLSDDENTLFGADFNYFNTSLIKGKAFEAGVWHQITSSAGEVHRSQAYGGKLGIFARSGFFGAINHKSIEKNFNPALGFVNWRGIHDTQMFGGYTFQPKHPLIREIKPSFFTKNVMDMDGDLLLRIASIQAFEIISTAGDSARLRIRHWDEIIKPGVGFFISEGVFVSPGDYDGVETELVLSTSKARPFYWHSETLVGDFYDGDSMRLFNEFGWQMNRNIFLGGGLTYQAVDISGGDFITRLATLRVNVAFNSKIALLNFVQYDNVSDVAALNTRLKWKPRPGDEYSFIANYGADIGEEGQIYSRKTALILKAVRTFRF